MEFNICTATDSYKVSHAVQYPPKTEHVGSYFTARGKPELWGNWVTWYGLQYFLSRYLCGKVVTPMKLAQAVRVWGSHFGKSDAFPVARWTYILDKHDGRLPISIRALPEGLSVPPQTALMTVENTDPECYWLTNWLETLLVQVWYPMTVCTQSRLMKTDIAEFLERTGSPDQIGFKLHDFGFRGVTCPEQAALGGSAHLVNFLGTDTFPGCLLASDFYGAEEMVGFSIPASEHSTITSWGPEHELDAFRNMLDQYPAGLVACVSDSYDIYRACRDYWGTELRDKILARDGTLVVRPDSGYPPEVVVKVLDILGAKFGTTKNDKGFSVLPPQIRVIQGDGIDRTMLRKILARMFETGWSADNIAFGSGGGLLQKLDRDTLKCAFKASWVQVDGEVRDVYKDPVTDVGKRSARGKLKVVSDDAGSYKTVRAEEPGEDLLVDVFRDGQMLKTWTFDEVRSRAAL